MDIPESKFKVAGYVRISQDVSGERWGVEVQREKIVQKCRERGWTLVDWYEDNSVSASKLRGAKTDWVRMLRDADAGVINMVVAVDVDRLLRSTRDLNVLVDKKLAVVTVDGEIDLSTADGVFRGTMLAAIAQFETRRKAERQLRSNAARRDKGQPVLSGKVPFGYDKDGMQVPQQAAAVRKAFDDFLRESPVSIRRIAADLNAAGHRTTRGTEWSTYAVRYMLDNPLYAGKIKHYSTGELYPVNEALGFKPIVPVETSRLASAKLSRNRERRTDRGNAARYLLSGVALCGKCGAAMVSGQNERKVPNYKCGKLFHLSRQREPVDAMVTEAVLTRLSAADAAELFAPQEGELVDWEALRATRTGLEGRLDELTALLGDPDVPLASTKVAMADVRRRLDAVDAQFIVTGRNPALDMVADAVVMDDPAARRAAVDAAWEGLDADRRRMIVRELVTVTIMPAPVGVRTFDPSLIEIEPQRR